MGIIGLVDRIVSGYTPDEEEVLRLLEAEGEEAAYIFNVAGEVTRRYCSGEVHLRGIIEFSNHCRCRCAYCGLTAEHLGLERYRMAPEEILAVAREAWEAGYRTIVLQSGEDAWYTRDRISEIIQGIKAIGDMAVTLSVGERGYEDYRQWREDGADRFLLKHETTNRQLYDRLHPHSGFNRRIRALKILKVLGYQVGSGFMIGLPGQTLGDIARDILFLEELKVDMAGIGPFIPHASTALKDVPAGSDVITLKALAVTRLILKTVHLPATTALLTLKGDGAPRALEAGANVIMLKLEPPKYRRLYEIYPKTAGEDKTLLRARLEMEKFIEGTGRRVSGGRGDTMRREVSK